MDGEASWLPEDPVDPARPVAPGVTAADLAAFHRRPPTPAGWRFVEGLPCGPGDGPPAVHAYLPSEPDPPRPCVVFVHGGGWTGGHPFAHIRRACLLAARGYVTATVAYRRAGEARWPMPRDDVRAALAWAAGAGAALGVDPERLALAGDSAGAHLAICAAAAGGPPVRALVLWSPVVDPAASPATATGARALLGRAWRLRLALGHASPLRAVARAGAAFPPVLMFAGTADDVAPIWPVRALHAELEAAGVHAELAAHPGEGHGFEVFPEQWASTFEAMAAFLAGHVGAGVPA